MGTLGWIGVCVAAALAGLIAGAFAGKRFTGRPRGQLARLIRRHFHPTAVEDLTVSERRFPFRMRADLQLAVDAVLGESSSVQFSCGVHTEFGGMGAGSFSSLLNAEHFEAYCAPPEHEDLDVGEGKPVRCLKNGLWLLAEEKGKHAVYLTQASEHGPCGVTSHLIFQVATAQGPDGVRFAEQFFKRLEDAVAGAGCYRGKVLSLEAQSPYSGQASGITVHKLHTVRREEVILPAETLDLLDRNVIRFADQRGRLAQHGQAVKKGILLYGSPGTGKTHTIHYLAGALTGHTTLLITAEQVALLGEYMTLARLLQPSVVVLEDVDLVAQERTRSSVEQLVLLHKLLNEMDGLKEDAEILFILTTNRPEMLETALASRPGRIDQAIGYPLPDAAGRERLVRLYSQGVHVPDELAASIVRKTENTSAAFIKELMRRSFQFHLEHSDSAVVDPEDVEGALEEMLFRGGSLNLKLLGARPDATED